MSTKQLCVDGIIDTGEYKIVCKAVERSQSKYRKGPIWRRIGCWLYKIRTDLGWTRYIEPSEKYKKKVELMEELPTKEELPMAYVMAMSIRSGQDPKPEKVAELVQQQERITGALSW